MEINTANQSAWLACHGDDQTEYPNRLAYALAEIIHYLGCNEDHGGAGYKLTVEDDGKGLVTNIRLTGPSVMHAACGVEISNAITKAGLELMCADWQMEFHWPAHNGTIINLATDY